MKTTIDDIHIYVNIDSLLHIILLVLIVLVLIVFIGFIIDHNTTYDNSKLFRKIKKRTGANTMVVDKNITLDTGYGKEKRE